MCLNPGLDRGLAFVYAQGGAIVSDDGKTEHGRHARDKAAVQWYLDLFKNGIGMTAERHGRRLVRRLARQEARRDHLRGRLARPGDDLDASRTSSTPGARCPTGSSGSPVTISYTAAYAIGADSKNKDQAWVLLQYLVGKDGMTKWTEGGVALPSRSDVPTPKGKDVLVAQAEFAKPGSGLHEGLRATSRRRSRTPSRRRSRTRPTAPTR